MDVESELDGTVNEMLVDEELEKDWVARRDAVRGGLETTADTSAKVRASVQEFDRPWGMLWPLACR